MKAIRGQPWDGWVQRVVLHVPHYLSAEGETTSGGRQRNVKDIARIVKQNWGRQVVVVQKSKKPFEVEDTDGTPVIGIKTPVRSNNDPFFGKAARKFLQTGDAIVYFGAEAHPYIVEQAKAFQVGISWDGPFSWFKRLQAGLRIMALFRACRSVACVDTNMINWLRCRGAEGLALCNKCIYIPNCVDLAAIDPGDPAREPHSPLKLIFARRYAYKRGGHLYLEMLKLLKDRGFPCSAILCVPEIAEGDKKVEATIHAEIAKFGLQDSIQIESHDMDSVLGVYAQADVSVVPTIWSEGTSYTAVESLCAGLPVITTPVGGLGNLVIPEHNGYVVPPVAKDMAAAVERFDDTARWKQMRQNCLALRPALSYDVWQERVLAWLRN